MDTVKRAQAVLEMCAHEVRMVEDRDKGTLIVAIQAQIDEALRFQLREFNKTIVNKARLVEANEKKLNKRR